MADNILDAACQRESPQAAKRMRLDTDHEDGTSVAPSSPEAEVFVDHRHPNKLLEGLNRLRLNRVLCDVVLCCEGQEVPCHRSVLASFSPYFEAMFTCGMRESTQDRVTICGLEPPMIGLLVNYAYTSEVSISADNVQALLAASDLLDLPVVREACCEYMRRHMDVNNCVEIYCYADDHSCGTLKEHSMDYILEYFPVIYKQEAFLSLSVDRLTEVLSRDYLNVPEEYMVFEAAMLWLDKCRNRKQSFGQVLEHIRLPLISPSYLHTVVESLDVVREQQGCQRFISEAKGEQPYSNTAQSRGIPVIVMLVESNTKSDYVDRVKRFHPLTNQWKTLARLPSERKAYAVCASASGSSLYLAGGCDNWYVPARRDHGRREMWRYDVHHNSWLEMAPMNEPRYYFALVMLDGCMFAVGGENSENSIEEYHVITDKWHLMESDGVGTHFQGSNVAALDGHLYFIGDYDWPGAKYNPKTSVWTEVAPLQIPRVSVVSCVLNGKIYVTGDVSLSLSHANIRPLETQMECYNPQTNQWTMCASMQVERVTHPSMVVVDGKLYVLGGLHHKDQEEDSPVVVRNIECYCEETDMWKTVGQLPYVRHRPKCVSLKLRNDGSQPIDDDSDDDSDDSIDDDSDDSIDDVSDDSIDDDEDLDEDEDEDDSDDD